MHEDKRARPDHAIQDFLAERWSPYGFDPRPLPAADLRSLFEAARWAPSAFNEQPWRYLVARREDEAAFADLLSCLVEANRQWAQHASALVISVAALTYARNGKPNGTAHHDLGLAAASLTAEATRRGLVVHQMGGILPDRVRELYGVPGEFQPLTALAIGYAAEPQALPDAIRRRDTAPRQRRPQREFVFARAWGEAAELD
jgi:nitroreductase